MSTEIQDTYRAADHLRLATKNTGEVEMRLVDGAKIAWGEYLPANLIAAVEAECGVRLVPADAVVVLREELPEVEVTSDGKPWAAGRTALDAEHARGAARAYLALAAWHAAHPPVDDEQVDRIATVLADDQTLCSLNVRARALYLAGVRFEAQP